MEWGEYRLGDLFEISNTFSFNKEKLVHGYEYEYVTRTSQNQGVLQTTGFVNEKNINPAKTLSLGLLQMDFFYRHKPWYAGQFVRKITPKYDLTDKTALYFSSILNAQKSILLAVLVRNVDETFNNTVVQLPTKNGEIDFVFMESFIAELEAKRIAELEAYLQATGLKDYQLTTQEQQVLTDFEAGKFEWEEYRIEDVLVWQKQKEINPLHLDQLIDKKSQKQPFYGQSTTNNGVISYNQLADKVLNNKKGMPTILIHSNNQNIVYLESPFYLKDGHGATSVLQNDNLNKLNQICFIASIDKVIKRKYSYNNKATKIELKNTVIKLPTKNNQPDYALMETLISAIQKQVIKNVVLYAENKLNATKKTINH